MGYSFTKPAIWIAEGPTCPRCKTDGFDDWWHDPTTRYTGVAIQARLKCHGCGKFFSVTQYPDNVCHSTVGL